MKANKEKPMKFVVFKTSDRRMKSYKLIEIRSLKELRAFIKKKEQVIISKKLVHDFSNSPFEDLKEYSKLYQEADGWEIEIYDTCREYHGGEEE